ncbi:hypothetical protein QGM71_15160 [Virgibacillus sp. C22-A2]|uniref:Permease n=1 Tax=Virgibacillus tibetensis TaxID=3042313 RepID=A0ABU6KIZ6_9BACI|nr:hypothetical protein [Virgibacillus sp. C22-A2]
MKKQFLIIPITFLLLTAFYQQTVYANSSWQWLTSSPKQLLPFAIVLTIGIEVTAILVLGKLKKDLSLSGKTVGIIAIANLVSFIIPYFFRAIEHLGVSGGWGNAWYDAFASGPYYIVLSGYLFFTIAIELPIIYSFLSKYTNNKRNLLGIILSVNILTTIIVAVMERMMFPGQW